MIVAVRSVHVMQVTGDQVVHVPGMRNGFVAAAGPMLVGCVVLAAGVVRRARVRIGSAGLDSALVDMGVMSPMKVPVVDII